VPPLHGVLEGALQRLEARFGAPEVGRLLALFAAEFSLPQDEPAELLAELLLFAVQERNPALARWLPALHEGELRGQPLLATLVDALADHLEAAGVRVADRGVIAALREPEAAGPELSAQLRSARVAWSSLLANGGHGLLRAADLLSEEERERFPPGPGPPELPALGSAADQRNLSRDGRWMSELVLQAKNASVWLSQLSRRGGEPLRRLDDIPDSALAELAEQGMSGLWLIGIWERSVASAEIKRRCGNPEALASAYSLRRYRVAEELGGEEALERLAERAARHGLRLAADMVPNHMGIDSDWVIEHPERFIGLDHCPFPNYTFDGPDLSPDPRVSLQVEDHYYDRSDAAVVFRRTERATGAVRYLYHGNDGTSIPWNDTAQLDYLLPEVREAVVETILEVARRFPVVRFDAAMTLARQHFQRLWYPPPGEGGAIPSRSEHGLDEAQFRRAMPEEFWRTVVERVAAEAPDTLLLAEAFWLMEGYFVRSLGMHRVYNSAFMHMMRDRENARYRAHLREAQAFDREILKRYVNFMSNPDEETARAQFGGGERYFGVTALMATLPGLPMFAHGQVEGLAEKYGMEYAVAYHDESPEGALVEGHRRRIAPLLACRDLTGGIDEFLLFDLVAEDGTVEEDVIAFGNGSAEGRILVLFNHSERRVSGRLSESAPFRTGPEAPLERRSVADLWRPLGGAAGAVEIADAVGGERSLLDLAGLEREGWRCELEAFEFRAFVAPAGRAARAVSEPIVEARADGRPEAATPELVALLDAEWAAGRLGWEADARLEALERAFAAASGEDPEGLVGRRSSALWTLPLVARRLAAAADPATAAAGAALGEELARGVASGSETLAGWVAGEPGGGSSGLVQAALAPDALALRPAELGAHLARLRAAQEAEPDSGR